MSKSKTYKLRMFKTRSESRKPNRVNLPQINANQSSSAVDELMEITLTPSTLKLQKMVSDGFGDETDVDFDTDDSFSDSKDSIVIHDSDDDPDVIHINCNTNNNSSNNSNNENSDDDDNNEDIKNNNNSNSVQEIIIESKMDNNNNIESSGVNGSFNGRKIPKKPAGIVRHRRKNAFLTDFALNSIDKQKINIHGDSQNLLSRIATQSILIMKDVDKHAKLDKNSAAVIAIKNEIISTEQTYVDSLEILYNEFLLYFFKEKLISKKHKPLLLELLKPILVLHKEYLNDFKTNGIDGVLDVFITKSQFLNIYTNYIAKYDEICNLIATKEKKKKDIQNYLKQKRREKKVITTFLIMPVQRVPRYLLLLNEIKKNTNKITNKSGYNKICLALKKISKLAHHINNKQTEIQNISACFHVYSTVSGLNKHNKFKIVPYRQFIKQFVFTWYKNAGKIIKPKILFVFNDLIVTANAKWKCKDVITIKSVIFNRDPFDKKVFIIVSKELKHGKNEFKWDNIDDINEFEKLIKSLKKGEYNDDNINIHDDGSASSDNDSNSDTYEDE